MTGVLDQEARNHAVVQIGHLRDEMHALESAATILHRYGLWLAGAAQSRYETLRALSWPLPVECLICGAWWLVLVAIGTEELPCVAFCAHDIPIDLADPLASDVDDPTPCSTCGKVGRPGVGYCSWCGAGGTVNAGQPDPCLMGDIVPWAGAWPIPRGYGSPEPPPAGTKVVRRRHGLFGWDDVVVPINVDEAKRL